MPGNGCYFQSRFQSLLQASFVLGLCYPWPTRSLKGFRNPHSFPYPRKALPPAQLEHRREPCGRWLRSLGIPPIDQLA